MDAPRSDESVRTAKPPREDQAHTETPVPVVPHPRGEDPAGGGPEPAAVAHGTSHISGAATPTAEAPDNAEAPDTTETSDGAAPVTPDNTAAGDEAPGGDSAGARTAGDGDTGGRGRPAEVAQPAREAPAGHARREAATPGDDLAEAATPEHDLAEAAEDDPHDGGPDTIRPGGEPDHQAPRRGGPDGEGARGEGRRGEVEEASDADRVAERGAGGVRGRLTPRQARRLRMVAGGVLMVAMAVVLVVRLAMSTSVLVVGVYGAALILCGVVIELSRQGRTRIGTWLLVLGLVGAVVADWLLP